MSLQREIFPILRTIDDHIDAFDSIGVIQLKENDGRS
jgi:hypothetical protein